MIASLSLSYHFNPSISTHILVIFDDYFYTFWTCLLRPSKSVVDPVHQSPPSLNSARTLSKLTALADSLRLWFLILRSRTPDVPGVETEGVATGRGVPAAPSSGETASSGRSPGCSGLSGATWTGVPSGSSVAPPSAGGPSDMATPGGETLTWTAWPC